jgi:hypothetical protein
MRILLDVVLVVVGLCAGSFAALPEAGARLRCLVLLVSCAWFAGLAGHWQVFFLVALVEGPLLSWAGHATAARRTVR